VRFTNVTIPKDAIIVSCFVRFTAYIGGSSNTVNINVYFDTADNPSAYANGAAITGASLTSAIAWNSLGAWVNGNTYDTPELKTIFQGIVDAASWNSGDAVIAQFRDNGSTATIYRAPSAYDWASGSEKAELHVQWVE
jgi:hypothetical protein